MLLTTYVNKTAYSGLKSGAKELPKGSILIKENYKPDKTLAAITVMDKTGDGKDDWYWVKYMPDGSVAKKGDMSLAGKPGGCIGCHAASTSGVHNIMTRASRSKFGLRWRYSSYFKSKCLRNLFLLR